MQRVAVLRGSAAQADLPRSADVVRARSASGHECHHMPTSFHRGAVVGHLAAVIHAFEVVRVQQAAGSVLSSTRATDIEIFYCKRLSSSILPLQRAPIACREQMHSRYS